MRRINFLLLMALCFSILGSLFSKEGLARKKNPYNFVNNVNPVFVIPDQSQLLDDEMHFLSEVYKGSVYKNEFRTATGQLIMDRVICPRKVHNKDKWIQELPANYGIAPGRFNVDGDPLDLVVLGMEDTYKKMIDTVSITPRVVSIVGIMRMEECDEVPCLNETDWINDWKVLAVDPEDTRYADVRDVSDLTAADRNELAEYWSNYKGDKWSDDPEGFFPQTRVNGYIGKEEALDYIADNFSILESEDRSAEITKCHGRYKQALLKKNIPTVKDEEYTNCLQRVYSKDFVPSSPNFQFFLKYNAVHRLLQLKGTDVTIDNVFDKLQTLKDDKSKYYRYVSYDQPDPGSGQAIFEWVLTKNRNAGCPDGTPPQHYETRPLVDLPGYD